MYAGCYLSLPRHCISPSVWHMSQTLSPINAMVSPSLLSLNLQYAEGSTCVKCSVHTYLNTVKSHAAGRIIFLLSSLDMLHEYYTCWVDSQKITWLFRLKRHRDGCEMLERHRRTQCWPTPSITHAEQMTQFSPPLSSSGWVYQCCPEYLTGKRAHPWDLICTGVHLVEVVWDNLHIMSHLHPGARKTSRSLCAAPATSEADGLFADTVAKTSVCCANPRGS